MTLAELGEKANLSISYLSQIERDKTSPSLTTLETIARSLNIGLRYLFESENEVALVVRANKSANAPIPNSPIQRQPLMPLSGNPEIEVYQITIQPHSGIAESALIAGEEIIFVLQGELTTWIGDEQFILNAGDSLHYDALLAHRWMNAADQPCIILWGRAHSLSDFQSSNASRVWNNISLENEKLVEQTKGFEGRK
jgi:transcriptional regulator with XRE-family HTH domain